MKRLQYPITNGVLWNIIQKISQSLNIPVGEFFITANEESIFVNTYNIDLTAEQKIIIDNVMQNNPTAVPVVSAEKTLYKLPNIAEMIDWFGVQWGITPRVWFGEKDASGECYIYLQFPRALTKTEKTQVIALYTASVKEVI